MKVFPLEGKVLIIPLPLRLGRAILATDGKSVYGTNATGTQPYITKELPGLARVEFNPTRASAVPGTSTFTIERFALSVR